MRGEWNSKENRSHVSFDYIEGHVDAFIAVLLRAQFLSEWLMTESARDANHRATLVVHPDKTSPCGCRGTFFGNRIFDGF